MSTQTMTRRIAEYFREQPVNRAWLFGSFARGDETPDSDIDILVDFRVVPDPCVMTDIGMAAEIHFLAELAREEP